MAKTGKLFLKAFAVPGGVSLGSKKFPPHVVIKAVDLPRLITKKCYDFAADEAARAGNQQFLHRLLIYKSSLFVKRSGAPRFFVPARAASYRRCGHAGKQHVYAGWLEAIS
jgi:hypothetical protein